MKQINKYGETWKLLEAHLTERLGALRAANDDDLDIEKTARIRGKIALCKELLQLPDKIKDEISARMQWEVERGDASDADQHY